MTQTVNVSHGEEKYTLPTTIVEVTPQEDGSIGADISGDTVLISLGTYQDPGDWVAGVVTRPTLSSVSIKIFVDSSFDPGTYWVHVSVGDGPETEFLRGARIVVT